MGLSADEDVIITGDEMGEYIQILKTIVDIKRRSGAKFLGGMTEIGIHRPTPTVYLQLPARINDQLSFGGIDLTEIKKSNNGKVAMVKILADEDMKPRGVGFFFLDGEAEKS